MIRLALGRLCFARLRTWRAVSAGRPTVRRTTLLEAGMPPLYTRMVMHVLPRLAHTFRTEVEKGLAQIARGEVLTHEEAGARIEKSLTEEQQA